MTTRERIVRRALAMLDAWIAEQSLNDQATLRASRWRAVAGIERDAARIARLLDISEQQLPN